VESPRPPAFSLSLSLFRSPDLSASLSFPLTSHCHCLQFAFSALTLLVGRQEGRPACKKTEWWGAGVVICLERDADLHTAQLMQLLLAVSCFSKIQIGFTFLVPAHPGSPGQRAVKRVCVCVCVCVSLPLPSWWLRPPSKQTQTSCPPSVPLASSARRLIAIVRVPSDASATTFDPASDYRLPLGTRSIYRAK